MTVSVFLSYPAPYSAKQKRFIARVEDYLKQRGLSPRTLGVTDYDLSAPLTAIRRLMLESNGLITIAFRRTHVEKGISHTRRDDGILQEKPINNRWLTTPWAHIEPAMAYQIGLPILIFRQSGVLDDGILERGVVGLYVPEFDLGEDLVEDLQNDLVNKYFESSQWIGVMSKWEGYVRATVERKGNPPALF